MIIAAHVQFVVDDNEYVIRADGNIKSFTPHQVRFCNRIPFNYVPLCVVLAGARYTSEAVLSALSKCFAGEKNITVEGSEEKVSQLERRKALSSDRKSLCRLVELLSREEKFAHLKFCGKSFFFKFK